MRLIVGLGNPGIEYQLTPHNLGFLVVDRLADESGAQVANRHCRALTARTTIGSDSVLLAKPETYMNLSGLSVRELVEKYEIEAARDLLVIYDELDLPFGQIRVRPRGSAAGHNGVASIISALNTDEFLRIRMGIAPDQPIRNGAQYVLQPFKKAQYTAVDEMLDTAISAAKVILNDGVQVAMNRFNRKVKPEGEDPA